ncbi:MAG: hypothetical protein RR365_11285 [Bacteroides sp.]
MPKAIQCPYFKWEQNKKLHCEAGIINFEDDITRETYTNEYCANVQGYDRCTLADFLTKKYERKGKQA